MYRLLQEIVLLIMLKMILCLLKYGHYRKLQLIKLVVIGWLVRMGLLYNGELRNWMGIKRYRCLIRKHNGIMEHYNYHLLLVA